MRAVRILVVAAVLLVAGCGDDGGLADPGAGEGSATAEGGAEGRTCGLLADEEIEEILGEPVREARGGSGAPGQDRCSWFLDAEQVDTLHLIVYDAEAGQRLFEGGGLGDRRVGRLGDRARWAEDLSTLYVLVEGTGAVMVQLVTAPPREDALDAARDLAALVVDRL